MYLERSADRIKSNPNLKLTISLGENLSKGNTIYWKWNILSQILSFLFF